MVPYENLAMEQVLTEQVQEGQILLYLWQNERTVVIGRNQNAWKEVRVEPLERDGGYLARRFSGGGAVFHDTGNLNFSFCVRKEDYDIDRQLEVILRAVRRFGIPAEKTGRNDITVNGAKFSGNAFLQTEQGCCHHGTIMLEVDSDRLSRYLHVSQAKLKSKGVDSVRARVCNLKDLCPDMTVDALCEALIEAFAEVYDRPVHRMEAPAVPQEKVDFLASWDWRFGRKIPFTISAETRFSWGGAELALSVNEGRIREAAFYTDAMDPALALRVREALTGCRFQAQEIREALAFHEELAAWAVQALINREEMNERV